MGFECEMRRQKLRPEHDIMTDTLFLPNGRWSEHLITDNYRSLKCMRENVEGPKGEGIQDGEGPSAVYVCEIFRRTHCHRGLV